MKLSSEFLCPRFAFSPQDVPEPRRYTVLVCGDYIRDDGLMGWHAKNIFQHVWDNTSGLSVNVADSFRAFVWKYLRDKTRDDYIDAGFSLLYPWRPVHDIRLQNNRLPGQQHRIGTYAALLQIMQGMDNYLEKHRKELSRQLIYVKPENKQFVYNNFFVYQLNRLVYGFKHYKLIGVDSCWTLTDNKLDLYVNECLGIPNAGLSIRFNLSHLSYTLNVHEEIANVLRDNFGGCDVLDYMRPYPEN